MHTCFIVLSLVHMNAHTHLYRKSATLRSTQTTQTWILWRPGPQAALTDWSASRRAASGVRVEVGAVLLAAEAVLTGREETPIGQAPTLTPQGLSGSRTTSSLAPSDIDECTSSAWCAWAHVDLCLCHWLKRVDFKRITSNKKKDLLIRHHFNIINAICTCILA